MATRVAEPGPEIVTNPNPDVAPQKLVAGLRYIAESLPAEIKETKADIADLATKLREKCHRLARLEAAYAAAGIEDPQLEVTL